MLLAGTWFSFVNPMGLPTIKQPVVGRVCARPATGIFVSVPALVLINHSDPGGRGLATFIIEPGTDGKL
jgi:hypothetical protein